MTEKVTYLLPIWIDLQDKHSKAIMKELNDALGRFFGAECRKISEAGLEIDVRWGVMQHINLNKD